MATTGTSSTSLPATSRTGALRRLRRVAAALLAAVAVVVLGSDAVAAAGTPPPAGQDVSWPQCPAGQGGYGLPMPAPSAPFVVVGLTGGRAFTTNPCLGPQVGWARAHRVPTAAYLVVTYPTRAELRRWSTGSAPLRQRVHQVGVAQAAQALAVLRASGLPARAVWIDVEHNQRRPWAVDPDLDLAVVQGVAAAVSAAGYRPGLYTNASSWALYADGAHLGLPEWRTVGPRPRGLAEQACAATPLNGGPVLLVQYWTASVDSDVACPVLASRAARARWFARG